MQKLMIRLLRVSSLGAAFLSQLSIANAAEIGVNAVQNFGTCANHLPNTVADAAGFLDHRPGDLTANYFFADDNVWQQDWTTADYTSSGDTATGFAGADSSMLTYLATHGDSSGGIYYGSLSQAQGCSFNNSNMSLGDAKNRYLFLSTCYGLMLGNGQYLPEHPAHSAEDLQQTWDKGLVGTRCIFSYGTVSLDSADYGKLFWEKWNQAGVTNANAFLNASWAVSTRQQPVVMCFGRDLNDANGKLDETVFSYDASSYGYNAWTWYDPVAFRAGPDASLRRADVPRRIRFTRATADDAALAFPALPRRAARKTSSFASDRQASPLDGENVLVTTRGWRYVKPDRDFGDPRPRSVLITDDDAIRIAQASLNQLRLQGTDGNLKVAYVRQQKAADSVHPQPTVINRMVAFEQDVVNGYSMLGSDGKLFVSVDAAGEVREIEDTRIKSVATADRTRDAGITVAADEAEKALMALARKRWPGAKILAAPLETGYLADGENTARLVARLAFTATQGNFSKADEVTLPLQ
ncbi:DUF6345 domain-containing protein [Oligoflexus tunisiensis]|uniref:DUF6345 domain-containing protein n=1 Tax=Oligoflexus tunisiensis TaxID=708132 RepID=UPI00114D03CC|nr:DUF6345 domain-containing protein [Oligoflexus tunisiensis]